MKDVAAGQEHGFSTQSEVVLTHCADRSFVLLAPILLLTVTFLNRYNWDLLDDFLLGRLLLLLGLLSGEFHYPC
jgi:hypothetical protein